MLKSGEPMTFDLLRARAKRRRCWRAAITIVSCSALFGGVFVTIALLNLLPDVFHLSLARLGEIALLFLLLGAAYGTVIALDRSAPKVFATRSWLKPLHSPRWRALICSLLGTAAAGLIAHMALPVFDWPWVLLGTVSGLMFGWFGWRWARHIDF